MNFSFSEHNTTGTINGDDLVFFYYDIGLDKPQGWQNAYDWNSLIAEFKGALEVDSCTSEQIPSDFITNNIRFTVSNNKISDNGSKSIAFSACTLFPSFA